MSLTLKRIFPPRAATIKLLLMPYPPPQSSSYPLYIYTNDLHSHTSASLIILQAHMNIHNTLFACWIWISWCWHDKVACSCNCNFSACGWDGRRGGAMGAWCYMNQWFSTLCVLRLNERVLSLLLLKDPLCVRTSCVSPLHLAWSCYIIPIPTFANYLSEKRTFLLCKDLMSASPLPLAPALPPALAHLAPPAHLHTSRSWRAALYRSREWSVLQDEET